MKNEGYFFNQWRRQRNEGITTLSYDRWRLYEQVIKFGVEEND